jgi:hypothetical protein
MPALPPLSPSRRTRPTPPRFKSIVLGPRRWAAASQVRLRSDLIAEDEQRQACQLLDAVGDEALTLSVNMETVRHALDSVPYDRSTRAAAQTVRRRLAEMDDVANALFEVLTVCSSPAAAPLLANDAPLADYLRGVVAWWRGILQAFEQVTPALQTLSADWGLLRRRIEDAGAFLLPELVDDARADLIPRGFGGGSTALLDALDVLLASADWLARGLREPFG